MGDATTETFEQWAIVEMMGHRRLAGLVREVQLAGHGFLRLDIPATVDDPGRSQYLSPGSVYALHPVTEETARTAAAQWRPAPVQRWELPAAPVREPSAAGADPNWLDSDPWNGDHDGDDERETETTP